MLRYICLFLLLLTACKRSDSSHLTQVLRINIGADIQTLDPRKVRSLNDITVMHMLFEGLTRISRSGEIELALAERVESLEDGLRYVFHLRKSNWSNGDPVTSFDFAEGWRTILDPQFPTDMAYQLYSIKNAHQAKLGEVSLSQVGIHTPDPQTLVIDLERPVPYFLKLLSMPAFFPIPHKIVNRNPNWALAPETFISNGPFILQFWRHSDQMRLAKNGRYWEASQVSLKGIDIFMMSQSTEIQMFEEGKLDWAGSPLSTIPVDAVQELKGLKQLKSSPFSATYFFRVNTSERIDEKKSPLSSPLFRKALALSINRSEITEHILQGGQIAALSFVPFEMGLSTKGYFQDYSIECARALLVDALLELDTTSSNLEPIKISYSTGDPRNALIAQAIQKQWTGALDLEVELDAVEPKVFFQRISQGKYQLATGSWTADFDDPINFLEVFKFKGSSTNNTNWESAKYIDLLNGSQLCGSLEERKRLLREAEQILMEQMPIIPVFHYRLNYIKQDRLEDVALSPLGQIDFRWVKLNSSLQ